jgi:hypothetical protein
MARAEIEKGRKTKKKNFLALFTMCLHQVPKGFPSSSQCVPKVVPNNTTLFISYALTKIELSCI